LEGERKKSVTNQLIVFFMDKCQISKVSVIKELL